MSAKFLKKFNEMNLYLDATSFLSFMVLKVKNMSKDDKICFGYDILNELKIFLLKFRSAYEEIDRDVKIHCINDLRICLKKLEVLAEIAKNTKALDLKSSSVSSKYLGVLEKQLNGWENKLSKK